MKMNLPTPYVKVPTLIPSYTVTVKYVDEQGNTIADTKITAPAETGSTYDVSAWDKISIDGYTYKYTNGAMTGILDGDKVITVFYTKLYTVIYTDGVAGEPDPPRLPRYDARCAHPLPQPAAQRRPALPPH